MRPSIHTFGQKHKHTLVYKQEKHQFTPESSYPNTLTHRSSTVAAVPAAPLMKGFSFQNVSVPFPSRLAPPLAIISAHHFCCGRIVVFKHNLSSADTFMFCSAYSNCRLCVQCSPFTGQAHNEPPRRGPYLWKGPPTLHTIQPPLLSIHGKRPPWAECLLCAPLFVCFGVFWKQQPFTPLFCDASWYNDADPPTGNNLEPFLCVFVPFFVAVCESTVLIALWNYSSAKGGGKDHGGVICSMNPGDARCWSTDQENLQLC